MTARRPPPRYTIQCLHCRTDLMRVARLTASGFDQIVRHLEARHPGALRRRDLDDAGEILTHLDVFECWAAPDSPASAVHP